ncbi:MAG TPA: biotin--[acetyl-CoA-carboxylase] ligase [Candidatus Marinimicrobia bacterium]|nr:biotin--[acetyl-CoA-carboxylase] ligase [Candidatus Neomarinimicrobiota bacterium]HRS50884.1 biotin--[acetyl-CoA-carboxylase] ligase [Candidatus Neomarinimicrobiota bacterium]HRU91774.1 biotin--[acetyl-CoA-carboxylase] ligase [Candidatus Neomarinimicrobiota bacterium]
MSTFRLSQLPISTGVLKLPIIHFEEIDSTNAYLLSRHSHPSGTIVWADFQSAGRGRLGRSWMAPPGEALLFSIYLKIHHSETPLFIYPFLTAVGVLEGLQNIVTPNWLALKWPNDVLLKNLKVCGILVQSKTSSGNNADVIIGIGINLNQNSDFFMNNLPFAGSLFSITGKKYESENVLAKLIYSIDQNLVVLNDSGTDPILEKWRKYCPYIGQKIKVNDGRNIHSGVFNNISEDGGLILQTGRTKRTFHAAEVTIVREK